MIRDGRAGDGTSPWWESTERRQGYVISSNIAIFPIKKYIGIPIPLCLTGSEHGYKKMVSPVKLIVGGVTFGPTPQLLSLGNHVTTLSLPGMAAYLPCQGACLVCLLQRMLWIQWTFLHWDPNKQAVPKRALTRGIKEGSHRQHGSSSPQSLL